MSGERTPDDAVNAGKDAGGATLSRLEQYFGAMCKAGASDLHFKTGSPPYIRVKSEITAVRGEALSAEEIEDMVCTLMTEQQRARYLELGQIDLAHELPGSDRFRINVYRQRGTPAVAVRRVTKDIPDFEALHLPQVMQTIAQGRQGLVLLSGPTGCGKSTTIAAMLQYINKTRPCHIVTIEDPIEYLYEDSKALINQRALGIDVMSFESALRGLMREDPDVVLIGEMRDRETFQAALQVSETGHLVFGTVHASTASQTIGRILDLFPHESRNLVRQSLAFNLRAIVCQRLLASVADGIDLVPAVEVILTNPSVRQYILEDRDAELPDVIRTHEHDGMRSFTQSLLELIEKDLVDPRVAYEAAPNVDELKMLLKGITPGQGGLVSRG